MLVLLHSIVDSEEHERYLFLPVYENSLVIACTPMNKITLFTYRLPYYIGVILHTPHTKLLLYIMGEHVFI